MRYIILTTLAITVSTTAVDEPLTRLSTNKATVSLKRTRTSQDGMPASHNKLLTLPRPDNVEIKKCLYLTDLTKIAQTLNEQTEVAYKYDPDLAKKSRPRGKSYQRYIDETYTMVDLSEKPNISIADLSTLSSHLPKLRVLYISGSKISVYTFRKFLKAVRANFSLLHTLNLGTVDSKRAEMFQNLATRNELKIHISWEPSPTHR